MTTHEITPESLEAHAAHMASAGRQDSSLAFSASALRHEAKRMREAEQNRVRAGYEAVPEDRMEYVEKALQQLWFRLTGFNDSVSAQVRRSVESVLLGTFDFDPYDPDWSGVKGWHDIHPNWVSWTIPRAPTAPATAPVSRPVDTGDFILGSPW